MDKEVSDDKARDRRVFWGALSIVLAYMAARWGVNSTLGSHAGLDGWQHHDLCMTPLRFAGLVACLLLMRRQGGVARFRWDFKFSRRAAALLVLATIGELAWFQSTAGGFDFPPSGIVLGVATTAVVAGFEESLFRGLFYSSLRARFGAPGAAALSSLLFMVFHWGAQPVYEWPQIFGWGMLACGALELGAGLWLTALAHEITDVQWFFIGPVTPHGGFETLSLAIYALALVFSLRWTGPKPDPYYLLKK
jgi:membrane protease YdiL (CAAX protease family)